MSAAGFRSGSDLSNCFRNSVDYVVIGAMAAMLQGAGSAMTLDVDVPAATDTANRERLAAALKDMDAKLRVSDPDEAVEIPLDAWMLVSASVMTFVTRFGPLDAYLRRRAPTLEGLRARPTEVTRFGVSIRVADVEDVVAMKRATDREKDAAQLTTLVEFLMDRPAMAQEGTENDDR
jgi:hypothetical protein